MKILKNILFWVSTVCLLLAIAAIAVPKLFGVEFRAVTTASMRPEIPVGSLVVIVPTKAEDIQLGDDITFVTKEQMVVTHRVVKIDLQKNEFTTWGIANDKKAVDAPNMYDNIIGVVRLHIPLIGMVFNWVSTLSGKIMAATVILAIYILSLIFSIWSRESKDKRKDLPKHFAAGGVLCQEESQVRDLSEEDPKSKALHEKDELLKDLFENDPVFKDLFKDDQEGSL